MQETDAAHASGVGGDALASLGAWPAPDLVPPPPPPDLVLPPPPPMPLPGAVGEVEPWVEQGSRAHNGTSHGMTPPFSSAHAQHEARAGGVSDQRHTLDPFQPRHRVMQHLHVSSDDSSSMSLGAEPSEISPIHHVDASSESDSDEDIEEHRLDGPRDRVNVFNTAAHNKQVKPSWDGERRPLSKANVHDFTRAPRRDLAGMISSDEEVDEVYEEAIRARRSSAAQVQTRSQAQVHSRKEDESLAYVHSAGDSAPVRARDEELPLSPTEERWASDTADGPDEDAGSDHPADRGGRLMGATSYTGQHLQQEPRQPHQNGDGELLKADSGFADEDWDVEDD
jgi:hypothetical protein